MKTTADRLDGVLERGLAAAWLVTGDEPLGLMEAAEAIRARARAEGVTDRTVLFASRGFDWSELVHGGSNLSLFADRRLIEVRLATPRPDKPAAEALAAYLERSGDADVLLVLAPRLDRPAARAAWVAHIERRGVVVAIWPVERERLPQWIMARLRARGLEAEPDAVALLADRVEGNLLAAAQEVDKLALGGSRRIDVEAIEGSVADSARYDVFKLIEAALAGDLARTLHVLDGLRAEGAEPLAVLGSALWQLRTLAGLAARIDGGEPTEALLRSSGIWARRLPLLRQALARHDGRSLRRLIAQAARVDRTVKGARPGEPWQELATLVAGLAARPADDGHLGQSA